MREQTTMTSAHAKEVWKYWLNIGKGMTIVNEKLFQSKKKKYLSINIGVINKIYVERKENTSEGFLGRSWEN